MYTSISRWYILLYLFSLLSNEDLLLLGKNYQNESFLCSTTCNLSSTSTRAYCGATHAYYQDQQKIVNIKVLIFGI